MIPTDATLPSPPARRHGALDAAELADAAVSAALVMALLTTGRLLAAGTFFQVLSTIVMAVLAARRRTRAVAASTTASMALAVLLGGIGPITQAFVSGLFGWAGGVSLHRRYGLVRHVGLALAVCWPIVSAFTVAFLAVFADTRELSLENGRNQWLGMAEILETMGLDSLIDPVTRFVDWSIRYWWLMVPALQILITIGYALIVRRVGRAVLRRVDTALGHPWHASPHPPATTVAPVPVAFTDPTVDRNGHEVVLSGLSGALGPGDLGSITGANGVGKTSLLEGLAGLDPTTGISRNGDPGLGAPGGTALIGQRPETQVVGLRVIDDLRWGNAELDDEAVAAALRRVGLDHQLHHATSQLSGGELQRLAIAAALARRPALLLSDEATAMLDPAGRRSIIDQLVKAASTGTTVLHSTHLTEDLDAIPRMLTLGPDDFEPARIEPSERPRGPIPILEATDVGFVHSAGSPWARRTLQHVDLAVHPGGLALVIGANGSGKTTLGRLLAGLDQPTEGRITLAGRSLSGPTPAIAVAFQHPRLQLLRSTVLEEVASLAGTREATHLYAALRVVGLDGRTHAGLRIDALSGGQQRRVLLAGIFARESEVVILDEPLAGLDAAGRRHLENAIDAMRERGTAVVIVSHDPSWAADSADTVLELAAPDPVGTA